MTVTRELSNGCDLDHRPKSRIDNHLLDGTHIALSDRSCDTKRSEEGKEVGAMQSSRKWLEKTLAAGLMASALFAGTAFAADNRMQAQKATSSRRAATETPRTVEFKTERTDSWLCQYVSPFFCSSIPTAVAAPQPGATTNRRGRQ
jgi:hypothetical protein